MLTQELIEYIRQAQNAGMTEAQIRNALAESGWARADIEQALAAMNKPFDTERAERIAASIIPAATPAVQQTITPAATPLPTQSTSPAPFITTSNQSPAPAQPTPSTSVEVPATHKRRTALIVGIAIGTLVLFAGSAYAYVAYTSLPRVVIATAAKEAARVTTYETEESFKIELRETGATTSPKPVSITITATAAAQYDYRASTTPRVHTDITVEGDMGGVSMQGGGEFARVGNEFFVRVRDIPAVIASDMGPMYTYFHDRWFSFNGDTFINDLRDAGMSEDVLAETQTSLDQALKPRDRLKIIASIIPEDLSVFTKQQDEMVDNEMSRVYTINGTRVFWIDVFKKLTNTTTPQELEAFDELMKTIEESVTDATISGTVWIGKDSHQIRKLRLLVTGTAVEPQTSPAIVSGQENTSVAFTLEYTQVFKKFNEPVEITKPDPATSVMDMVLETLTSLNVARAKGADAGIKSHLSMLRAQAELYYDPRGNYGTPFARGVPSSCPTTPGSTMFGSAEFQEAFAQIREYNGGRPLTCATDSRTSGVNTYAISSPLMAEKSFCIDSSGQAAVGKTATVIGSQAVCR